MSLIKGQYILIQNSRLVLFQYCSSIDPKHFVEPVRAFDNKSILDLLVHIAKTYFFWIGEFALKSPSQRIPKHPADLSEIRGLYSDVDAIVLEMINAFHDSWDTTVRGSVGGKQIELSVSALELFTHVTTHEFHHKGQILSMSRLLGYTPVDTDIIRF